MRAADIPGFPGYRITDDGRVQSLWRRGTCVWSETWRDLRPSVDAKGYFGLTICNKEGRRKIRIHRLVAQAFVPNQGNLPCVRHLDGNPANNRVGNLAWGTYADNEDDKHGHGTWIARVTNARLTDESRNLAETLRSQGMTHRQIALALGVSRPTISRLLNGKTWRHQ